jgi:hypothetical protein
MSQSPVRSTLLGAGLGLAWGAGWRGWMAVLAGEASRFTWLVSIRKIERGGQNDVSD